jgi:hypothetical protein
MMVNTLENPFYYLDNFQRVLACIDERYSDLLNDDELAFITRFAALPVPSRALLVRMVMRKGGLFRANKLKYDEIGCTHAAAQPLVALGWIDDAPLLSLEQLFGLMKKAELAGVFPHLQSGAKKADQLEALRGEFPEPRTFSGWSPDADDRVFQVRITSMCDRFRLMFFGNLRQDWTEFVLSDLGIYKYEKVAFSPSSRGFRTRRDVDDYLDLYACRERFEQGEPPEEVLKDVPGILDNEWIEGRRGRLLFQVGQYYERAGEPVNALAIYRQCGYAGARLRVIRILERSEQFDEALALADSAGRMPESEAEQQQLARIMPRLRRKLGQPKMPVLRTEPAPTLHLRLPQPEQPFFVEGVVRDHLHAADAPVHYVENTLINSLFGLLCWDAIFAAVPGAFFHPFHHGPADLLSPDFHQRRGRLFADCLARLDTDAYRQVILGNFALKAGIQSPFVAWPALTEELITQALDCVPAAHLKTGFERMLLDIQSNRSGLPDLIRFWPREKRYQMIEVKGPGDRLQDNQVRWIDYCMSNGMPVTVCYVEWTGSPA